MMIMISTYLYFPDLPFMSVNLTRRARALQTLRLPDDIIIPDTSQRGSYRAPRPEKYAEPPSSMSMKPRFDDSLQSQFQFTFVPLLLRRHVSFVFRYPIIIVYLPKYLIDFLCIYIIPYPIYSSTIFFIFSFAIIL